MAEPPAQGGQFGLGGLPGRGFCPGAAVGRLGAVIGRLGAVLGCLSG